MDEGPSRRSLSPYHEKCFPPYCDSAQKVDKTQVSKMTRSDLEDRYIIFADENLEMKKQIRNHERHIQRLQAAMARQGQLDKRAGRTPVSVAADCNRIEVLEAQNQNLTAKVKVLKQQLMNHSHYHFKNNGGGLLERKSKDSKGVRDAVSSEFPISQTQSAREGKPDKNTAVLKQKVAELEEAMEAQKKKYIARISQLEKELASLEKEITRSGTSVNEQVSEHSQKVNDNKELIKLRMMLEREKDRGDGLEVEVERLNKELEKALARARELDEQLAAKPSQLQDVFYPSSNVVSHTGTTRDLEEQIRDLKNENQTLKDTNEKLLQLTQKKSEKTLKSAPSGEKLQLQQRLQELMSELDGQDRTIKVLQKRIHELEQQKVQPQECQRCDDLAKQLCEALKENQKLQMALEDALSKPPPKMPSHSGTIGGLQAENDRLQAENSRLKSENQKLLAENNRLQDEINKLKTECKKLLDEINGLQDEINKLQSENKKLLAEINKLQDEINRLQSENKKLPAEINRLQDELERMRSENKKLQAENSKQQDEIDKLKTEINRLEAEIEKLKRDLEDARGQINEMKPIVSEHQSVCANRKDPTPVPSHTGTIRDLQTENARLLEELEYSQRQVKEMKSIVSEHQNVCVNRKDPTPVPSHTGMIRDLQTENSRLQEDLNNALAELKELRPVVKDHMENCGKPVTPVASRRDPEECANCEDLSKQLCHALMENQKLKKALEEALKRSPGEMPSDSGEVNDLRSQLHRITEENKRMSRQVDDQLEELRQLRPIADQHALCPIGSAPPTVLRYKGPTPMSSKAQTPIASKGPTPVASDVYDEALREQNSKLEDQLAQALQELQLLRPIAEEHMGQCGRISKHPSRQTTPAPSVKIVVPSQHESYAERPQYESRVSLPPSVHCAETIPINDPAQKPNLVIVSQHDFEKVLMKKKKYQTDTEVMESVDGRQILNCKLEICMYDLEVDDSLIDYLKSLESDPRVYVDWDFVGLDQRTAPLPPDKALFYTNVIYYGPLSDEIKSYLRRSDMPVNLFLVRSSAAPFKVATGTLNMLPAMENPNRGFMRSVYLKGVNVPGRSDKSVGIIHCSFILHECCLGDPPFRDQLEIGIGTLNLKNRDGGVVPDHATHIYVEYSLLGHCGPDLETDSVPRGEVMKFKHHKKLRVNDENSPYLKAMLTERNPKPLRFTVLAEPCSLTDDTEVETVGYADLNLVEEMINKDRDIISCQVPVYDNDGENLGTLSVTVLGIATMQQYVQSEA